MKNASVTVVMSTFNEERYVDKALDAVANQTIAPHVVVVDGGSSDATVERLRARAARDPRIHVLSDGRRRSLPEALNLALEYVTDDFVAKIDARTFPFPDFLEQALAVFAAEGVNVGCVGGRP
ncbi:MAG: glycosyltransferase, partial [Vulcanimicrobiaceae bacterium]